jgi:hypothetical protein
MNNTKYRFTLKSRNSKTGPIPVTTTEEKSCPDGCPLKNNGCFADGGPLAIVWKQVETMGKNINALCQDIKALPQGQLWRHNQAGDLPHKEQSIDILSISKLITVNQGKRGFTYTHHKMNLHNKTLVKRANSNGFTINLSGNNLKHADSLYDLAIAPVVVVLPSDQVTNTKTPKGRKVTVCPAAIDTTNKINCKTCGICAIPTRKTIVGFPAHGMRKRAASEIAA